MFERMCATELFQGPVVLTFSIARDGLDLGFETGGCAAGRARAFSVRVCVWLTALRADPPFSWVVTSTGPPGGRSLSKDGTRADSANDFCRLVGGVIRRKSDL